ncbi:MAG: radical SAM protein [Oligoflexales bacterium]|nr:radical SAM protein [Oligoflexales bacterium]
MIETISQKIALKSGISVKEATWLYKHASLDQLSQLATQAKALWHKPDQASYLVMAIVNYTNICVARCDYCAFYKLPHEKGGYLLSEEELFAKIDQLLAFGGTLVSFNGGFHPKLRLEHYAAMFEAIHKRYPNLTFFEMTVAEFMFSCKLSKLSYQQGAELLRRSGTNWVTGGGAEILDDSFRKRHSPGKFRVDDYYTAQKAILEAGLGSTATMVIGFDESLEERFNHLQKLRNFQASSPRALPSFLCWTYKPYHTELGGTEISRDEYLRWLAICRIYLHNFKHIRTSVLTQNEEGLLGLRYGADDFDLPVEDEVTEKAGAKISHDFKAILNYAQNLGFEAQYRSPFRMEDSLHREGPFPPLTLPSPTSHYLRASSLSNIGGWEA